jgi:hypothetical protein
MKTLTNTTAIQKLIDLQLRELLKKDLENFKLTRENKQAAIKNAA